MKMIRSMLGNILSCYPVGNHKLSLYRQASMPINQVWTKIYKISALLSTIEQKEKNKSYRHDATELKILYELLDQAYQRIAAINKKTNFSQVDNKLSERKERFLPLSCQSVQDDLFYNDCEQRPLIPKPVPIRQAREEAFHQSVNSSHFYESIDQDLSAKIKLIMEPPVTRTSMISRPSSSMVSCDTDQAAQRLKESPVMPLIEGISLPSTVASFKYYNKKGFLQNYCQPLNFEPTHSLFPKSVDNRFDDLMTSKLYQTQKLKHAS